jgi:hypothetical protein
MALSADLISLKYEMINPSFYFRQEMFHKSESPPTQKASAENSIYVPKAPIGLINNKPNRAESVVNIEIPVRVSLSIVLAQYLPVGINI